MSTLRPASYSVIVEREVPARMRDGPILRSVIYRPDAPGKFPVLVNRSPYGSDDPPCDDRAREFAERGYVAIRQDLRGRYRSEGVFSQALIGLPHTEVEDGYDTAQWAAQLPYSDGKIGIFGISYHSWTAWALAASRPPALRAMASGAMSADSRYRDLSGIWRTLAQIYGQGTIACDLRRHTRDDSGPHTIEEFDRLWRNSYHKWVWFLPLADLPEEAFGRVLGPQLRSYLRNIAQNNHYGGSYHSEVEVPCLHITGWYDQQVATCKRFIEMRQVGRSPLARENQKLIIGPWRHNVFLMESKEGDLDFGPEAATSYTETLCRWYDFWLKGIQNGVMEEPPVRVFVMGANRWREAADFPLPGTRYRSYYLHSQGHAATPSGDGSLNSDPPAEEPHDTFSYDPRDPVPSLLNFVRAPTPRDQRLLAQRPDILVYQTVPLSENLEIIGILRAVLYVSSSAPDTDFFVRLIDVYPDGLAINVCMGVMRARYRDGFDSPKLLNPYEPVRLELEMLPTGIRFLAGHRIRLDVTSSDFPNFDRNHNRGLNDYEDAGLQVAQNVVFHDSQRPSHIDLPIAPADDRLIR